MKYTILSVIRQRLFQNDVAIVHAADFDATCEPMHALFIVVDGQTTTSAFHKVVSQHY